MTNDEAMELARIASQMEGDCALRLALSGAEWRRLCDHILSGDMRREIENAAYELARDECEAEAARLRYPNSHTNDYAIGAHRCADAIATLIHPPAQKENGK